MNLKLLIIGFVWPEPKSSAAGLRMVQLIEMFLKYDLEILFASAAIESEYTSDLLSLGLKTQKIELNSDSFDVFLKEFNPNIVLFDRFMIEEQFGWRVSLNCPNALRILDTEDLHSLRLGRHNAFKKNKKFELEDLLLEEIAKREIASILRCDLTLMVSEFEIDILKFLFKIAPNLIYYLPIFSNLNDNSLVKWKDFEEKKNFLFIGNFLHEPNWDAVKYLKTEIWPLIRKKMSNAIVEIYGAYPSQKVFQLNNKEEGFLIMGRADDANVVFNNSRVLLAPIRFGAGIKGKLLEAMQTGTPSVTTSIGAEAINGTLDWNGFIEDDAELFAEKVVQLYNDENLWNSARENGMKIITQRFQQVIFEEEFIKKIKHLLLSLEQHRKNNFLGALLQHHTLKSTEYMSRWIQEKNKT